jgi:hypothetical protein
MRVQPLCAYVSIRQHTPAYVSIRRAADDARATAVRPAKRADAYVSIRQHTSAYANIRQHTQLHQRGVEERKQFRQNLYFCTSKQVN